MNQKERLAICSKCTRRKLDFKHGFLCQLTGKLGDFAKACKHFELDETATDTIKVRTKKRPMVPLFDPKPAPAGAEQAKKIRKKRRPTGESLKKLRRYQSLFYALAGGLLVMVLSAVAWAVTTSATGYQGAYMALGVGLLVGLGVRFFGAGIYKVFGILAAMLTLAGSLLGYYLSRADFLAGSLADMQLPGYMEVVDYLSPELLLSAMPDSIVPKDILFYGLAILLGYLLAIRRINARKMAKLERGDYKGAPLLYWLRLPLILAGILLPAYFGYTMTTQGSSGLITLYYESGTERRYYSPNCSIRFNSALHLKQKCFCF